jgi:hypothetical protein
MIKRQNTKLKLFILFTFSFLMISYTGICENQKDRLMIADSLFAQKKYTQSFDLYQEIYTSYGKVSPSMLLKMAFVKEGLGDYSNALYYLNLYYLKTYDKKVLKKMENLAERYHLEGYNYDDAEFFLNLYQRFQIQIDLFVTGLLLIFLGILVYQKRKNGHISAMTGYAYISLLVVLLLVNNFGRERKQAIISSDNAYLMDGPSPGADVIDVVAVGHRVKILGHQDVWVEISWDDKSAYIKEFNLKPIEL